MAVGSSASQCSLSANTPPRLPDGSRQPCPHRPKKHCTRGDLTIRVGKKGRLYLKFTAAAALLFTLVSALYTLAANPSASPAIVANSSSAFKRFKRTMHPPQNRSLAGYWKLDGNANDSFGCWSKIINERVRTK